ncbi:MAG TPA: tetratricopeptide repeat protein, partial [Stellaceae bacterium]|nr:tetratricopeptide repeat protein [Stellaceae bacterium]
MTDIQNQLDALYAQALDHFRAERFGEAEALGREILALQPKLAQTLHLMSAVALRGGRVQEAAVLVERAIALDGRVATFHNTLGEIYRQQGQVESALACYERALALQPDFAHARGNIEQILAGCDDKVAIAYYRRQVEAQPGHAPALANLASAFARAGEAETAVTFYRQGLALNAAMPNVLCNLGLVLSDLGRLDEAIDCYLT